MPEMIYTGEYLPRVYRIRTPLVALFNFTPSGNMFELAIPVIASIFISGEDSDPFLYGK